MVSNSLLAMLSRHRPVCQGSGEYLWCFWMSHDSSETLTISKRKFKTHENP